MKGSQCVAIAKHPQEHLEYCTGIVTDPKSSPQNFLASVPGQVVHHECCLDSCLHFPAYPDLSLSTCSCLSSWAFYSFRSIAMTLCPWLVYSERLTDTCNKYTFTIATVVNKAQYQLMYRYNTQSWTRSQIQFNAALTSSLMRLQISSRQTWLRRSVAHCRMLVFDARGRRSDTPLLVPNVRSFIMIYTVVLRLTILYCVPDSNVDPWCLYDTRLNSPLIFAATALRPDLSCSYR